MKKTAKILLILVLALSMAIACFGCTDETADTKGTMTLVIGTETPAVYTVELDDVTINEGLFSVLDYLKETKGLDYVATGEGEFKFLTKVGDLTASGNSYIYLYTSVEKDFDVSAYAETKEYNGKTLTSSGVGASSMTMETDATIYVGLYVYNA